LREKTVEDYLRKRIRDIGALIEKHVSPGQRGVPDDLITWPWGELDLVETKRPGGEAEEHQKRDHARRLKRDYIVSVLDTKWKVDTFIEWHVGRAKNKGFKW
jgi:hypothetical protein